MTFNFYFTDEPTINQTNCNVVDGIDLDEIKEFAKAFKLRRLSLGLTQTQVGQALSVTEGPAYSQSAICRLVISNKKIFDFYFGCDFFSSFFQSILFIFVDLKYTKKKRNKNNDNDNGLNF